MNNVVIGLGSNMGDREKYLHEAVKALDKHQGVEVIKCSSIYETEPYGPVEQQSFLNMAVEIKTILPPNDLLDFTQSIELGLKRERLIKWGPRTIDLDILLYADKIIETDSLIIPHPEITKRLFVLVPLNELNSSYILPGSHQTVEWYIQGFGKIKGVRVWKRNNGVGEYGLFEN